MQNRTTKLLLASFATTILALSGCSSTESTTSGPDGAGGKGTVTIGLIPSWTDTLITAYLAKDQLEKLGYAVEMEELTEAAILYTGLAAGDIDIYPSAWPDVTHASYVEEYGDDIEDLGTFYDQAQNFLAVPSYTDVDSIEDLAADPSLFDGQIIGIEPSAGLTEQTETVAMPEYDLDEDFDLVTSSTATMLAQLEESIANEEDIVVTLWRPYWANGSFDLKILEDPRGGMGDPETMRTYATKGFSDEHPDAAEYFAGFELTDDQWSSLEDLVINDYEPGEEEEAIAQWIDENPDAYETLIAN
ncbi:glycine betaine ABC transporter substrate-binding protein [Microbacterium karelineae]|uniref:glycine betaine ABC transporter substrate-binding protein n=1 Tax=Microbacterium karelineae TaxID=2654283 RepID=UPI0012EA2EBC|nr:glycine betaine ABC transporter substrate-binding protein [Microbacterium karelineae]